MTRRTIILGTLMILASGATQLAAHENFRIIGKIVKWNYPKLEVKEGDHTAYITVSKGGTDIYFHDKPSTINELKVGRKVVVDALGDTIQDLDNCLDIYIESQKVPAQ